MKKIVIYAGEARGKGGGVGGAKHSNDKYYLCELSAHKVLYIANSRRRCELVS